MLNPPRIEDFPSWVNMPTQYFSLIKFDQVKFSPWFFFDRKELMIYCDGLKERYPNRALFPFAKYAYSDDIACLEKENPGKVIIIHDYASPGWEQRHIFDSFEDWFELVLSQREDD